MGPYKGDYPTGFAPPLVFLFATFSSDDPSASVALSGIAVTDIEVYKNGSITQRSSDAGYALLDTDGIDFDGHVGIGGFSIDIDNNDDAGFFAAGQEYDVVLASITVDGATINFHAGTFSIERAGGALALIKLIPTTAMRGTDSVVLAGPTKTEMDTAHGLLATEAKQDIIDTNVDLTLADTANMQPKFVGITLFNEWLGATAGKQNADATALTEIKASGAGSGSYDPNTDSTEALRDLVGTAGAGLTDLGGMSTSMKAQVNVEVDGALDTSIAELGQGVPTATPNLRTLGMLLYMALRNKLDVATSGTDTLEIHNSAGTRITQKLLTDSGGDYSEAKMISGA